ncbi:MAG: AmmeMemoRadiSam system protein B [Chloroflexota bacterium]
MSTERLQVRQPRYADNQWYSSSRPQLQTEIEGYLAQTPPRSDLGELVGLVAPHAGHFFSGHVAGAGFANLQPGAFKTVMLLGPDHRGVAPGRMATPNVEAWRTPLGDIPVDWTALDALQSEIDLQLVGADHEHSLEIELPFLQVALHNFKLVPLIMGNQSPEMCRRVGAALAKTIGRRQDVLLVASSDLSHFYDDATARRLDESTLHFVLELDAGGLIRHVEAGRRRGEPLACGAGPMASIIHAAKELGATQAHLIKYATSGDVHAGKDSVVGYAAVAICKAR